VVHRAVQRSRDRLGVGPLTGDRLACRAGRLDAEAPAADFEPVVVDPTVDLTPEEPVAPVERVELESAPDEAASDEGLVEMVAAAPSSWVPVPSLHAVRESAASTAVAAPATRRVRELREVRKLVMLLRPFGVRVAVVIG
jgi:hypothetical protein